VRKASIEKMAEDKQSSATIAALIDANAYDRSITPQLENYLNQQVSCCLGRICGSVPN